MPARVDDFRCVLRRADTAPLESGRPVTVPVLRVFAHRDADNLPADRALLAEIQILWPRRHLRVATAAECRLRCSGPAWTTQVTTQARATGCAGPWTPIPAPNPQLPPAGPPYLRRPTQWLCFPACRSPQIAPNEGR